MNRLKLKKFMLNKMKNKKVLLIIAVIWLVLILLFTNLICPRTCVDWKSPDMRCGCDIYYPYFFLIIGIPSWIIFIYLIVNKIKNNKKK